MSMHLMHNVSMSSSSDAESDSDSDTYESANSTDTEDENNLAFHTGTERDTLYTNPRPDFTNRFTSGFTKIKQSEYSADGLVNASTWRLVDKLIRMSGQVSFPVLLEYLQSADVHAHIRSGNQFVITLWVRMFSEVESRIKTNSMMVYNEVDPNTKKLKNQGTEDLEIYLKGRSVLFWFMHSYLPVSHATPVADSWDLYFRYKEYPKKITQSQNTDPVYSEQTIVVDEDDPDLDVSQYADLSKTLIEKPRELPLEYKTQPPLIQYLLSTIASVGDMVKGYYEPKFDYGFKIKYELNSIAGGQLLYKSQDNRTKPEAYVTNSFTSLRNIILNAFGFINPRGNYLDNFNKIGTFADPIVHGHILQFHYTLIEAYNYQFRYIWVKESAQNKRAVDRCATDKKNLQQTLGYLLGELKDKTNEAQGSTDSLSKQVNGILVKLSKDSKPYLKPIRPPPQSKPTAALSDDLPKKLKKFPGIPQLLPTPATVQDDGALDAITEAIEQLSMTVTKATEQLSMTTRGTKRKINAISNALDELIELDNKIVTPSQPGDNLPVPKVPPPPAAPFLSGQAKLGAGEDTDIDYLVSGLDNLKINSTNAPKQDDTTQRPPKKPRFQAKVGHNMKSNRYQNPKEKKTRGKRIQMW